MALSIGHEFKDGTVLTDLLTRRSFKVEGGKVALTGVPSQTGMILAPKGR